MARSDSDIDDAKRQAGEPFGGLSDVNVQRRAEIPVGTQLVWALRARIADGRLLTGQRLPGVRELAAMFDVNVNTARAIYQRLEREGLVESRQGMGTFVAPAASGHTSVGRLASDAARRARELGVDPRELATALYVTPQTQPSASNGGERRRQLRDQIAALEQALAEIESHNPGLLGPPSLSHRLAGPRLLDAEELETVRARLVRRLTDIQTALDARAARSARADATPAKARRSSAARSAASHDRERASAGSEQASASKRSSKRSAVKAAQRTPARRPSTRPSTA